MELTPKGFKKPSKTDAYDIEVQNYNMDLADQLFLSMEEDIGARETPAGAQAKADAAEGKAKGYIDTKLSELIAAAPGALDTLKELADALGNDPNFATTVINALADKVSQETFNALQTAFNSHKEDNTAHGVDTKIPKTLATAADQFLVSSGASSWVIKTVAQIKTLLGLKSAAYTESSAYATAAQGTKADNALPKTGGTMTGILTAQSNTSYTVRQVRNIILSNADADVGAMQNGDIWIKYK